MTSASQQFQRQLFCLDLNQALRAPAPLVILVVHLNDHASG